jgi:hypothetical protein
MRIFGENIEFLKILTVTDFLSFEIQFLKKPLKIIKSSHTLLILKITTFPKEEK